MSQCSPTEEKYKRFELVQLALHHEQEIYWIRFTGFATLHAGLFVIATATNVQSRALASIFMSAVGVSLAALWTEVQRLSVRYVDRWKPLYHAERRQLGLDIDSGSRPLDQRFSSTNLGNCVPWAVGAAWLGLMLLNILAAS